MYELGGFAGQDAVVARVARAGLRRGRRVGVPDRSLAVLVSRAARPLSARGPPPAGKQNSTKGDEFARAVAEADAAVAPHVAGLRGLRRANARPAATDSVPQAVDARERRLGGRAAEVRRRSSRAQVRFAGRRAALIAAFSRAVIADGTPSSGVQGGLFMRDSARTRPCSGASDGVPTSNSGLCARSRASARRRSRVPYTSTMDHLCHTPSTWRAAAGEVRPPSTSCWRFESSRARSSCVRRRTGLSCSSPASDSASCGVGCV